MTQQRSCLQQNKLFFSIGISVALGMGLGFVGRTFDPSSETISLVQFPGEIFMRILKLMILPLVVASLISALAQMDAKNSSTMGLVTLLYYLSTAFLATVLGIFLVLSIHPGDPTLSSGKATVNTQKISATDTIMDLVRNMFPDNIVQASMERTQTVYKKELIKQSNETHEQITKDVAEQRGMNILVDFFVALDKVITKFMLAAMWFAPLGITSLIAGSLLELDDISTAMGAMTKYIATVLIGLFVHSFITIPVLYVAITRKNPLNIFQYMMQGGIAALGTSSSGAALPLSINGMEELGRVDERVTRFVLPLGATINMDGCALYEAVAVIFIAQINQVELRFDEIIIVRQVDAFICLCLNH
ncbi:unnamed protein product [Nippostrongylus brasiliensis]|uniref:Amino acid transporter n=1 Tax=Nippostrongylus brasiliensis TaxID=27835 RepID=A0A158QYU1_NIPBR|nr:unnamed protein product [Nippostrongylus brasiliensis]